jgi:hypothetical protein
VCGGGREARRAPRAAAPSHRTAFTIPPPSPDALPGPPTRARHPHAPPAQPACRVACALTWRAARPQNRKSGEWGAYWSDLWNWIDWINIALFLAFIALRVVALMQASDALDKIEAMGEADYINLQPLMFGLQQAQNINAVRCGKPHPSRGVTTLAGRHRATMNAPPARPAVPAASPFCSPTQLPRFS